MPRKKSIGGRKAKPSLTSQTYLSLEKANRRIKGLQKHGDLGTYASKDLMRLVSENKHVKFNRQKKLTLTKTKSISFAEMRLINKRLKQFNKAKTGTHGGIEEVKKSTREKMKETISGLTDREIPDSDVEFLYTLFNDKSNSNLFDLISPSELIIILNYAKEHGHSEEEFWTAVQRYIGETNQSDLKEQAIAIYRNYMQNS